MSCTEVWGFQLFSRNSIHVTGRLANAVVQGISLFSVTGLGGKRDYCSSSAELLSIHILLAAQYSGLIFSPYAFATCVLCLVQQPKSKKKKSVICTFAWALPSSACECSGSHYSCFLGGIFPHQTNKRLVHSFDVASHQQRP